MNPHRKRRLFKNGTWFEDPRYRARGYPYPRIGVARYSDGELRHTQIGRCVDGDFYKAKVVFKQKTISGWVKVVDGELRFFVNPLGVNCQILPPWRC